MGTIQFHSKVDENGVLAIEIPLGKADANSEVIVTIEPTSKTATLESHSIESTYGACADLGLQEPDDLPLQHRQWAE